MAPRLSEFKEASYSSVRTMTSQQFDQVVKAIIEGRYSWACVLILRFAGYNPAHYIPYRTYRRLIKENRQCSMAEQSNLRLSEDRNNSREVLLTSKDVQEDVSRLYNSSNRL